ncbi:MAG: hypothetical protein NTW20_04695, partial [Rhodobacterales bacterium]|nr:hypothetical protein [Rhodobacterales bacterium]
MRILDWLLRRKPKGRRSGKFRGSETEQIRATKEAIATVAAGDGPAAGRFPKLADASPEVLTQTPTSATVAKDGPAPAVNIWDMDDNGGTSLPGLEPVVAAPTVVEPGVEGTPRRRPTRTKTRVLGFEMQPASVVPLFDEGRMDDLGEAGDKAGVVMYPTGWLVIASGPGRGAAFPVTQGVSQIGRGSDQTVALDFGDMAISRQNHAAVAYDGSTHQFHIGHG